VSKGHKAIDNNTPAKGIVHNKLKAWPFISAAKHRLGKNTAHIILNHFFIVTFLFLKPTNQSNSKAKSVKTLPTTCRGD
jgi:hypothetical protein